MLSSTKTLKFASCLYQPSIEMSLFGGQSQENWAMATTLQTIPITTDLTSICLSFLTYKMWSMLFSHPCLMGNSDAIKNLAHIDRDKGICKLRILQVSKKESIKDTTLRNVNNIIDQE